MQTTTTIPTISNYYGDINQLLHDSRSSLLRDMPPCGGTMLSAGCSGRWYFEWIAERYKSFQKHIGIEFYSPKPDNLPKNVEWISNTVGDMNGVRNEEIGLVFSGQNLEHLWPEDVIGFFLESWRVLKPGGHLIIDSPNRNITRDTGWSHPEHTIEFTPSEVKHIAELAGFDVTKMCGIWLGRDPETKAIMPHAPIAASKWTVVERLLQASSHPDDSFIWWMEARKLPRKPDTKNLTDEVNRIFAVAWPERASRFFSLAGQRMRKNQGEVILADEKTSGAMVYGPYMPLKKGKHHATFTLNIANVQNPQAPVVCCDIAGSQDRVIESRVLTADEIDECQGIIRLDFNLQDLEFGIQARCFTLGNACVECSVPVAIV